MSGCTRDMNNLSMIYQICTCDFILIHRRIDTGIIYVLRPLMHLQKMISVVIPGSGTETTNNHYLMDQFKDGALSQVSELSQ